MLVRLHFATRRRQAYPGCAGCDRGLRELGRNGMIQEEEAARREGLVSEDAKLLLMGKEAKEYISGFGNASISQSEGYSRSSLAGLPSTNHR